MTINWPAKALPTVLRKRLETVTAGCPHRDGALSRAITVLSSIRMQLKLNNDRIWRWLVLTAGALYFLVRGPWRAIHDSSDFLTDFAAARCWIHGMNPYANSDLVASALAAGAQVSESHFLVTRSIYLPPALLLLSPLAALPWVVAKALWLFCSVGASLWFIASVAQKAKGWIVAVWSFLLAFAPLHTGISKGQPSVLVCALIAISIGTPQPYFAGFLLGTALCIKPHLALGFVFLAIALRQGRKLIAACTTVLVLGGVALMLMKPGSIATWSSNLVAIGSASGISSGSPLNPVRFQLITVDTLIPQALYTAPVVLSVYAIIALVSVIAVVQAMDVRLQVAVVASATVLIGYHHSYDAQILGLGIPAMIFVVQGGMSLVQRAGYGIFLIPAQVMAALWLTPRTDGNWWSYLLLHNETLACVMIWLIFSVVAIRRVRTVTDRSSSTPRMAWDALLQLETSRLAAFRIRPKEQTVKDFAD